jgi:L-2,4-diaminobutyrate decarboxylase
MHRPECNILCFRAISADGKDLDALNLEIRSRYNSQGTGWITTTVLNGQRVLRVTLINPRVRRQHLDAMVDELAGLVRT